MQDSTSEQPAEQTPEQPETQAAPAPDPQAEVQERFADLVARDREVHAERAKLAQEAATVQQAKDLAALAKADPVEFLNRMGVSYNEWTDKTLKGRRGDPTAPLQERLASLEATLASRDREVAARLEEQRVDQERNYVRSWVEANGTKFPVVKAAGAHDLVYQHIADEYARTGNILSEDKAAEAIEAKLMGVAKTLAGLEVVQAAIKPSAAPPASEPAARGVGQPGATLTNEMNTQVPVRAQAQSLSRDESLAAAAALLRFRNTEG